MGRSNRPAAVNATPPNPSHHCASREDWTGADAAAVAVAAVVIAVEGQPKPSEKNPPGDAPSRGLWNAATVAGRPAALVLRTAEGRSWVRRCQWRTEESARQTPGAKEESVRRVPAVVEGAAATSSPLLPWPILPGGQVLAV